MKLTKQLAKKVLDTVDAGLCSGLGNPIPGQMCVEAAVCFAMGLPHGDNPDCVSPALRSLKIALNDGQWSSNEARANGLRRLAIAQLGSMGALDEKEFANRVAALVIRKQVPFALRIAASVHPEKSHKCALESAAIQCENSPTEEAAHAAYAAAAAAAAAAARSTAYAAAAAVAAAAAARSTAYAAAAAARSTADAAAYAATGAAAAAYAATCAAAADAARDKVLTEFAEDVVQILIGMEAPGCRYLSLTEE